MLAAGAAVARRARRHAGAAPSPSAGRGRRRSATASQRRRVRGAAAATCRQLDGSGVVDDPATDTIDGDAARSAARHRRSSASATQLVPRRPTARRSPTPTASRSSTGRGRRPELRDLPGRPRPLIVDAQASAQPRRPRRRAATPASCSAATRSRRPSSACCACATSSSAERGRGRGRARRARGRRRRSPDVAAERSTTRARPRNGGALELTPGQACIDARRRRRPLVARRSSTPPSTAVPGEADRAGADASSAGTSSRPGRTTRSPTRSPRSSTSAEPAVRQYLRDVDVRVDPRYGRWDADQRAPSSRCDAMTAARPPSRSSGSGPGGPEHVTRRDRRARSSAIPHRFLRTAPPPERRPRAGRRRRSTTSTSRRTASTTCTRRSSRRSSPPRPSTARCSTPCPGSPLVLERSVRPLLADDRVDVRRAAGDVVPRRRVGPARHRPRRGRRAPRRRARVRHRRGRRDRRRCSIAHTHANWVLSDIKLAVEDATGDEPVVDPPAARHARTSRSPQTTWSELDRAVEADHLTCVYVPALGDAGRRRVRPLPRARPHAARAVPVGPRADPRVARAVPRRGDVRARRRARGARPRRPGDRRGADRGARRPALPDRVPRHDRRAGGALLDRRRHRRHPRQARAPPPARVRRRRRRPTPARCCANWEEIKRAEKGRTSVFDGVARSLPALAYAQHLARKAAKVGFDWPDVDGPLAKVDEELAELRAAIAAGDAGTRSRRARRPRRRRRQRRPPPRRRRRAGGAGRGRQVPPPVRGRRGARRRARHRPARRRPGDARRAVGRGQGRAAGRGKTVGPCGCSSPIRRTTRTSGRCRSPPTSPTGTCRTCTACSACTATSCASSSSAPAGDAHVVRREGAARPPRPAGVPAAARARRGPPADGARRAPSSPTAPATATGC